MGRRIWLGDVHRSRRHLSMTYGVDGLRFEVSYWYGDVDLPRLEERHGRSFMERVYFHILLLEAAKLVSLRPDELDLGPFARFHTEELESLWRVLLRKIWAQWRYEHDLPDYHGPDFLSRPVGGGSPVTIGAGRDELLSFCGGGKDSLVAIKLLERAGLRYSTLAYSSSVYGTQSVQHALIDGLLDHGTASRRHRQWIYDSSVDAPLLRLYPEYGKGSLTAAETPCSVFGAVPLMLEHGYRRIVVGHERSANVGNLTWSATGEDVNHQWGKSLEAERILDRYLRTQLVADASYFSLLQPVYDVVIFHLLRRDAEAVRATHSCNVKKPWCGRCPKCAYVGLGYLAYLPEELATSVLGGNVLDAEENQPGYRQMLGLEAHTPFECIGQVSETRLAFELCRRKGIRGQAVDAYAAAFPTLDVEPILARYLDVDPEAGRLPEDVAEAVLPQLRQGAREARSYIERILGT